MKILKKLLIAVLAIIFVTIILVRVFLHEPKPQVSGTDSAEELADKILDNLNVKAWDSLNYLSWSFPGGHSYVWDKQKNLAKISWKNKDVHLDLNSIDGVVLVDDKEVLGKQKDKLIKKAWTFWCNDSFWLFAPYKIKDSGTTLAKATDKKGKEGLLVSYSSGGVTPGDSYLWFIDESGRPYAVKMWVKVLPFGGLYSKWTSYESTYNGAWLAKERVFNIGKFSMKMEDIQSGATWEAIGYSKNPILINS